MHSLQRNVRCRDLDVFSIHRWYYRVCFPCCISLYSFDPCEHPLAGQLGGNNPDHFAVAAKLLADRGYDEININCGCPSNLVSVFLLLLPSYRKRNSVQNWCWIPIWFVALLMQFSLLPLFPLRWSVVLALMVTHSVYLNCRQWQLWGSSELHHRCEWYSSVNLLGTGCRFFSLCFSFHCSCAKVLDERCEYAGEPSHSSSAVRVGISAPGRLSLHRLYHQRRRQFLRRHARPFATRIVVFLSIWQIVRSVIVGYAASWSVAWRCRTPGFSATWTSFSTTLLVLTCRDDR